MFPIWTNQTPVRVSTDPGRPHRMLRTGCAVIELAAGVAAAGVAVAAGAAPRPALLGGVGAVVALGVIGTLATGATPARAAIGYRVEALGGGRPPVAGVVLRELVRPLGAVLVVDTVGFAGLVGFTPGLERWSRRLTRTVVVGLPRRGGAALVAGASGALAVGAGAAAVATWGGSLWEDAFLAWAAVAAAFGAAVVVMAREGVRWLEVVGELAPTEEATAADELDLVTVWDHPMPDHGAEVRLRDGAASEGPPDVVVSPRGSVATHKRRPGPGEER